MDDGALPDPHARAASPLTPAPVVADTLTTIWTRVLYGARSMTEVAAAREDHRDAGRVGRLDDLVVAHRAARLDDRA